MPRRHPCLAPPPASLVYDSARSSVSDSSHRPSPGPAPTAPPSPTRCSRLPASLYVAIEQIQTRRLGRCHREVPCASPLSRPPCADIRVTPPISLLALRRPQGPGWQEPRRMHPFFAECAKKAPFLATSARNACFSRSRWQHPRPMHPFPGAIGRFRIHGARILPPRALFRVEESEITHGAKMLPAPPGLSTAAACGPAERALRPAARAWPACRMRPSLSSRLCPPRPAPPAISPAFIAAVLYASRFAARIAPTHAAIRRASPCRAGPAAVPVIPAKWCGDTIAHTRKLRF